MSELLAPAGSMEALKAAIANGCDAVYLGMQKFGARAYSSNFDEDGITEAVAYAHLRDVKVYVTVNTIAYQDELPEIRAQLEFLNSLGVDGIIAQDLAVLTYVAERFVDMEAHCSTQMGIDDLEGTLLAKRLGARRVVLAREVELERVKQIRRDADIPVEIFIHGALCVSYSGNCIMSGMTGNRLGNRGRCIGSCRKLYDVVDVTTGDVLGQNYALSTKDLNTIDYASDLEGIDSLKIEGRMKEPAYVANVVSRYRKALDGRATAADKELLNRTFNRTFTRGYLMHEDRRDITNVEKPNNYGYEIGKIAGRAHGMYKLELTSPLRQNDVIRIRHDNEDINLSAAKIYDASGLLVSGADEACFLKIREQLSAGDVVYKTKDLAYTKEIEAHLTGEYRRFPLDFEVHAYPGAPLIVDAKGLGQTCEYIGDEPLSEARNVAPTRESVASQLDRLGDTVFELGEVELDSGGAYIPAKLLNAARKAIVEQLCAKKLASWPRRTREGAHTEVTAKVEPEAKLEVDAKAEVEPEPKLEVDAKAKVEPEAKPEAKAQAQAAEASLNESPLLTASVLTQEQYDACKAAGLDDVYFKNVVPRNGNFDSATSASNVKGVSDVLSLGSAGGVVANANDSDDGNGTGSAEGDASVVMRRGSRTAYPVRDGKLLVGGLGGIECYRETNPFVTDYSLNVVNAETVRLLQELGAKRVTLSYEINEHQLYDLLATYQDTYGEQPHLEMIVYGHAPLLVTKYCPLKRMGQCGTCRTHRFELREEFGTFPLVMHENCDTTVLNGKILNLLDEMPTVAGVEAFRLNFTVESAEEVVRVLSLAKAKLARASRAEVRRAEVASAEAAPTEAASAEAAPTETAPTEAASAEAAPAEAASAETAPAETAPTETAPTEAAPTEADLAEANPAESKLALGTQSAFNPKTDTRGHFHKEIL